MKEKHILLVGVETFDEEALLSFAQKLFFDMDRPGVFVTSVKEIRQ